MQKQDKLNPSELKDFRSFVVGFCPPCAEQPGFVSYFGVLKGERNIKLLDEAESPDVIELVEQLAWLKVRFGFREGAHSYRQADDFVYGDGSLIDLLDKHEIKIEHSSVLYGQDAEKPFITLLPEINRKRRDGIIVIGDESLLSLRLKDEALQNPAAVQLGDSPALQSLCYVYFGWKELLEECERGPRQEFAECEDSILG